MLDIDDAVFPNNVVKWVAGAMTTIDADVAVVKRPLRNTDPMQSIGVSAQAWNPDDDSLEIQGIGTTQNPGPQMPTLQQYLIFVQGFVKDTEEERGLATHSVLAQRIRSVLYTNPDLQVVLANLSVDLGNGWTESVRRWGIRTVRYFSGEIDAQLLYLSTLEFWVQTETRRNN